MNIPQYEAVPRSADGPQSIALTQTHRLYENGHELRADSAKLGWQHLLMLEYHSPPFSESFAPARDHLLLFMRRGTARMTCTVAGRAVSKQVYPGHMNLVPAGADVVTTIEGSLDTYQIYASADIIDTVLQELGCEQPDALQPQFGIQDQLLAGLVQACAVAMRMPENNSRAYVDHLAWALAAHLVKSCGSRTERRNGTGKISGESLRKLDDYIHAHLAYDLSVADLAKVCGYTRIHFSRLFREAFGIAPYQYRAPRLSRLRSSRTPCFVSCDDRLAAQPSGRRCRDGGRIGRDRHCSRFCIYRSRRSRTQRRAGRARQS